MATLILYKSKWGSTQQYAEWIAQEVLDGVAIDIDKYDFLDIDNYNKVVIGSRVYMGKIEALDQLKKNWQRISSKEVYLFMVGLIPMENPDSVKSLEAIPQEIRNNITGLIKLPGRVDFKKVGFFDKLIVKLMGMGEIDKVDICHISPIVEWIEK